MIKALVDVTSNVKDTPGDPAPYGSFLLGRLAAYADLPATTISTTTLFVEVEKGDDHVKMWKSGLAAGKKGIDGGDDAKKSSKVPRPAEERELVESTGMGWVEQVVLRGAAMAMGVVLSREQIHDLCTL